MLFLRFLPRHGAARFSTSVAKSAEIEVSEVKPHVFHVQMNRPRKRNTFTLDLWRQFKTTFDELSTNPKCRSIVVSGIGKSFCAGIDLQEGAKDLMEIINNDKIDTARKARQMRDMITLCQDGFTAIELCPKPVIAAIHSHCIGAGVDLITACDIRYASQDAVFAIREVNVGLAADVGTLNRIQKIVGNDSLTRELAYTARDFTTDEAHQFGLVSRVYDSHEEVVAAALDTAQRIAEKSPIAVQGTKMTLNYARDHTISDSLNFVKTWNQSQLLSDDLIKAAMGIMNKEKAEFDNV